MTEKVSAMLHTLRSKEYRNKRVSYFWDLPGFNDVDEFRQSTWFMETMLEKQEPVLLDGDIFGFVRHLIDRPGVDASSHTVVDGVKFFERYSNITPAYELLIDQGLDAVIAQLDAKATEATGEQLRFCQEAKAQLLAVIALCDRYRDAARAAGNTKLYNALCTVPNKKATSLYEACLFQKIITFVLRCSNYKHMTFGRFDQYMYPYYLADRKKGISKDELLEMLELYFISINLDSDLYPGVQQGDNGQSMVLGGYDLEGNFQYNELSELCLLASMELSLIDPKINLRVNKTTPDHIYQLGTKLTKQGLGFPQYCNDDVIVPGLIKLGYAPEDAVDYTVAACWEPIIPGKGADIPNENPYSFPMVLIKAIDTLETCNSFDDLMDAFRTQTEIRCQELIDTHATAQKYYFRRPLPVSPFISLMMHGCLDTCTDIGRFGTKYYNCGAFGAGLSTAADSMAAIKKLVFDERKIDWSTLKAALAADFEGYTELRNALISCPKMGCDDDYVDTIGKEMMGIYIKSLNGKPNHNGGVWRCGTGSAQNYIYDASKCGATADGRKAGTPYACSFSPAPNARVNGPLSVIRSFTKFDLSDSVNGGPLTMELHHNVFRNEDGENKVSQLVKLFILLGGHQLQLNALNREVLLDAQAHPEDHANLVVRVWGWSGYFCELDKVFQDHVLARTQYTV